MTIDNFRNVTYENGKVIVSKASFDKLCAKADMFDWRYTHPVLPDDYPVNLLVAIFGWNFDNLLEEHSMADAKFMVDHFESSWREVAKSLTEREELVLMLRFRENQTLEQVGKLVGVNRDRIRQIEAKALRGLRNPARLAILMYGVDGYQAKQTALQRKQEFDKEILSYEKKLYSLQKIFKDLEEEYPVISHSNDLALSMNIEELDLSVRTFHCLKRRGINTVADITKLTLDDLFKIRNLGSKSAEELICKLKLYNLKLKEN